MPIRRRYRYHAPVLFAGALSICGPAPTAAQAPTSTKAVGEPATKPGTKKPAATPAAKTAAGRAYEISQHSKVPANCQSASVADKLGSALHLVVTKYSDVLVRLANPVNGHGTVRLRAPDGNGSLDPQMNAGI